MTTESSAPGVDHLQFLERGGQLGALMRVKDWSGTPLGPISGWPQSLLTAVSVMLTAPQPSYVFWGPELAILYNDRGLPFVGHKHPDCLGHSIRVVLEEAWPVLGPLVEGVMSSGLPVYLENLLIPLDRSGFLQDGYFTFSYVPIRNERAEIGGILVIVNETTAQVLGERRLAIVRELSLRAALCSTVVGVLDSAQSVLAAAPNDLPFALLYELRDRHAHLVVCTGIARGTAAAPLVIDLRADDGWPLAAALRDRELVVDDLAARFTGLPGGPSAASAERALVLTLAGEHEQQPSHLLIAGLNPRDLLDDDARGFLQLLARQIATSITSTRALEEKTQLATRLAELDRHKTAFFSNVSHEFRTPLTLMLAPVEDALEQDTAIKGQALASVHRNALRLLKLVNNLLDFSRVEASRSQATFRPTDLAQLTTDLASGFRSVIESAGMAFEISCEPSDAPTYVDVDMWEKIVLNLLSNAFKFTFEGKIAVLLRNHDTGVVLSVSDTGVGVAQEHLPRLFDRFHRVQGTRSRSHEGSGIGLALVAELARMHGGTVGVESRVGEGTQFTVTIPRGTAHLVEASDATPQASLASTPKRAVYVEEAMRWIPSGPAADAAPTERSSARILVAEDNADMRDYLTRLLRERWMVETVADGEHALASATASPPDLIVSDMMMPGLDGLALVRALRKDERTREVPFILLSARADQQSTTAALEHGASDYMIKPFSARELLARVGAQLEIAAVQRRARQRLESFLMLAPAAIAVLHGASLVFVLANPGAERVFRGRALVGKPARVAIPELAAQGVWDHVDRVYATGEPFVASAFEVQIAPTEHGAVEQAFFDWVAQPTRGGDGAIDGVMMFGVEVTEQVRARAKLERTKALEQSLRAEAEAATRVAQAASRSKDEFLAMLGHELRNPLAPIATALQLMRLRGDDSSERERRVIERQVWHLEALVSDLLDVSRITQGKITIKHQPVEISRLLGEAIEMASPLLEQRHHHLDVRVARSGLSVDGDAGRLTQVFANLITNAAKYTEANGHIEIRARKYDGVVVVEVQDDGVGIASDMLPRVFELFSQEPQSLARSQGGLGIGLAIVRGLVDLHGGRVRAESDGLGRGSTFVVELPAADDPALVEPSEQRVEPLASQQAGRGARILVVDDNEDAAESLAELLRALGHTTEVAHDGPSALRVAAAFAPTIALLDIGLPVMDGYELAKQLRSEHATASVRLVAITGYGQVDDRRRSAEAGFDAHLVKPVRLDELERVLAADAAERR